MFWFFLALFFILIIPLAEGVLLAFVLREVHIRHPLPLGGTIGVRKAAEPDVNTAEESIEESITEDVEDAPKSAEGAFVDSEDAALLAAFSGILPGASAPAEPKSEEQEAQPADVSVFDGTENIPENLPISNVLEAMTTESATVIPNDFERIIDESSQTDDEVLSGLRAITDDMDQEDLQALADALPGTKIDFSQELETESEDNDSVSPMAKELLGEQFDIEALEKQSDQLKQSLQPSAMEVLEDESGTVQVSSPFMSIAPQFAEFTLPETILPTFSSDWIQESGNIGVPIEGDHSQFFYAEESQPMFVRKKKTVRA